MISHRSLLLVLAGCTAVGGTAAAQTPPQEPDVVVEDVIVTGAPFGVTANCSPVLNESNDSASSAASSSDMSAMRLLIRSNDILER